MSKFDFINVIMIIHSDGSAGGTRHAATCSARGNALGAIGHGAGHFDDVDDSSAFHRRVALIVELLRRNGFVFVESKGVMVGEVGACDGGGLGRARR